MIGDLELDVMVKSYQLIKSLDTDERGRVLRWLIGKFDQQQSVGSFVQKKNETGDPSYYMDDDQASSLHVKRNGSSKTVASTHIEAISTDIVNYSIHGLFDRIQTKTDVARVLLVAAYLQERGQGEELGSRPINKELKSVKRGIKNITQAINSLLNKDPQLLVMTRKTTTSQQGKKKYKVTDLGISKVKEALVSGVLKV